MAHEWLPVNHKKMLLALLNSFGAAVSTTGILTILSQWFSFAFVVVDSYSQWSSFAFEKGYAGTSFRDVSLKVHFHFTFCSCF